MKLRKTISALLAGLMLTTAAISFTTSASAASTLDDGLIGHWKFDDNLTDSSGNGLDAKNDSKKITFADGIHGKAAVFKGEQCAIVDYNKLLDVPGKMTISFWMYNGDTENKQEGSYINKDLEDGDQHYYHYKVNANSAYINTTISGEINNNCDDEYAADGCYWSLYTVTYDGKSMKLYQNDTLVKKTNFSGGITNIRYDEVYQGPLYFGYDPAFQTFISDAMMDDMRLYNRALDYEEVEELYKNGVKANKEALEPSDKCVAYFSYDKNVKDTLGNVSASKVSAGGKFTLVNGVNGKAIKMTKGNYIEVKYNDILNMQKEMTISYWAKPEHDGRFPLVYFENQAITDYENDYVYKTVHGCYKDGSKYVLGDAEFAYQAYTPEHGWLQSGAYDNVNTSIAVTGDYDMPTTWVHYTFVLRNNEDTGKSAIVIYINGKEIQKSEVDCASDVGNASGSLLIGYGNEEFFEGAVDELKIFNYALTKAEVKAESKRIDSIAISAKDKKAVSSIKAGATYTISNIKFTDIDENKTKDIKSSSSKVKFKSSNSKIFTVSSSGKITAKKAGTAKLTITYGLQTVTYTIKVTK